MLRSFRLGNYRSFRDEQELLLMPVYENEREVVPVAAIYGANASGKSNLIDGLRFMHGRVVGWGPEAGSGIDRVPFRLDRSSQLRPSVFAVELVLGGIRQVYGFSIDNRIREEWFYVYPRGRRRVLFERAGGDIDLGSTVRQRSKAEVVESLLTEGMLFLSLSARVDLPEYRAVFEWFRESLSFPRPNDAARTRRTEERVIQFLERPDVNRVAYLELARAVDVGIIDIHVEYPTDRPVSIWEAIGDPTTEVDVQGRLWAASLQLTHGVGKQTAFGWADESDGTRLWLHLLPTLIACLAEGKTMVIDEIDSSLHPLLVRKLVGLFRSPETNPNHAQLIFTTHDAFLLAPIAGEAGVDRDQVWFVEKQPDGASTLYPLSDFKPRSEHNLARRYLGGSYGAIPFLDDLDAVHISGSLRRDAE